MLAASLAGCSWRDDSPAAMVGLWLRNFMEERSEIQITAWDYGGETRALLASTTFDLRPRGEGGDEERSEDVFESVPAVIETAVVRDDRPTERHHHFHPSCPAGEDEFLEIRTWVDEIRFRQVCES